MRRQFALPSADLAFLEALGLQWETVNDNGALWLILHDYPIPDGYNHLRVSAAVRISPGYPDTLLDMVYFSPPLARTDGRAIGALTPLTIDGKAYQQWSRHRTAANPWRPGEDDLSTHMELVRHWLEREFKAR